MDAGPDTSIIRGARARYSCRTVGDVDAHLAGLTAWLRTNLPLMKPAVRRTAETNFGRDIDNLLHARVMLAALATLDADLAALGAAGTRTGG